MERAKQNSRPLCKIMEQPLSLDWLGVFANINQFKKNFILCFALSFIHLLDYRINMGRQEVKELVAKQNWDELLASDQLRCEHGAGNTFTGFTEGPITFPPTYK